MSQKVKIKLNMIFKLQTNFLASNFFKIITIFLSMGLIVSLAIESNSNRTLAETTPLAPQTFVTDANGVPKSTFETNETGFLTIRSYAKEYTSAKIADVVLLVDRSNSMNPSGPNAVDKCTQAGDAAINFVSQIDITKRMAVSVISYSHTVITEQQLLVVDSAADKQAVINNIAWSCSGGTDMTTAITAANNEFSARGRAGANRYAVLLTDGGENTQGIIPKVVPITETSANDQWFQESRAQNRAFSPTLNSALDLTKRTTRAKYFTIYYGLGGNTSTSTQKCTYESSDGNGSWGCPLMRYVAGYTNNIWNTTLLPTNILWDSDYRADNNNVDDSYFYKAGSGSDLNNVYSKILNAIEAVNAQITIWEKLSVEAQFEEVISAIDKGGRSYPATVESSADNLFKISLPEIPARYTCDDDDEVCNAAAEDGEITQNYVDVKIKLLFKEHTNFDLNSNYSGCNTGSPVFTQANSKIDYTNTDTLEVETVAMPAQCLNVVDPGDSLVISKSTYKVDPNTLAQTEESSFEAGDEVAVKLIVKEILPYRENWRIKDTLPLSVTEIKGAVTFTPAGGSSVEISSEISGDNLILQSSENSKTFLIGGTNIIEYHYKI